MELRYAGDDKLFVPVDRLDLVQKFSGSGRPTLDRLGGATWEKAKSRVKKAMRDMADELLKLYAARKAVQGHAFPADTHWQEEFEGAFPYELTPDQANAVIDIKRDMESPTPMDRLLCGDVGYGKTEVAMRAAFKAVMDGKQVAVLAPTTVLALQHLKTLRDALCGVPGAHRHGQPVPHARPSRPSRSKNLREGKLDILVGTHRLLAKDVEFRDLGLLVVDEEQRFGVTHKERIKQMRKKVDVLTMSATPIPRTLNMSLVGIRDMSVIETAPHDRQADADRGAAVRPADHRHARSPRNSSAAGRSTSCTTASSRSTRWPDCCSASCPDARDRRRSRADGRGGAREGHGGLHRAPLRRAAGDDDHRERPRHPERQHDDHQPRRPLRARRSCTSCAAASADRIGARTRTC